MIKAVIFDFGGVLVNEGFWDYIKENIPDWEKRENEIIKLTEKVDRGDLPYTAYSEYFGNLIGKDPQVVDSEFLDNYVGHDKVGDVVKRLKGNYKIGILSNFPEGWFYKILDKIGIKDYFDYILVSSEHALLKPDKEIYETMLKKLDVKPEEAIFIDDRLVNIEGAESLGIKTILFKNPEDLLENLSMFGVF